MVWDEGVRGHIRCSKAWYTQASSKMSNTRKDRSKRWLISRLKTSGSKRDHFWQGHYRDTRNSKTDLELEDLPKRESYSKTFKFYNGKINYGLLVRFLRGNIGRDWDEVEQEVFARIPTRLQEFKNCLYWFVADKVESQAGGWWCKREQKYLILSNHRPSRKWNEEIYKEFYVHPETHTLEQVVLESKRKTKGLDQAALRKFKAEEKRQKQLNQQLQKAERQESIEKAQEALESSSKAMTEMGKS